MGEFFLYAKSENFQVPYYLHVLDS